MMTEQLTANPIVAAVRAQTDLNDRDRALRAHRGPGGAGATPPNWRLQTFGMRIEIDESVPSGYRLIGGTARQRACYLRSVKRWVLGGNA